MNKKIVGILAAIAVVVIIVLVAMNKPKGHNSTILTPQQDSVVNDVDSAKNAVDTTVCLPVPAADTVQATSGE